LRTISHQVNALSAQPAGIILKKFCVYIDIYSSTTKRVSRKHTDRDNIYYFAAVLYNKALTNDFFINFLHEKNFLSRTLYEILLKIKIIFFFFFQSVIFKNYTILLIY